MSGPEAHITLSLTYAFFGGLPTWAKNMQGPQGPKTNSRGESKETLRYTACLLSLSSSACWLLTSDFYSSPSSLRFTALPSRARRLPEHSHLARSGENPA